MSFYDIKDPIERDKKIEALIKLTEKIKKRNYDQRVGYAQHASELEEDFQPILKGQEKIRDEVVKQLQPLHKQLEALVKREPDLVTEDDEKVENNDMLRKYVERLVGTRYLDRAGTSAEKKFTNLLGKNVSQAAVNLV